MSEWFKVPVLKTGILNKYRGFESSLIRFHKIHFLRVFSSVGRAIRLQRKGQWFESITTHYVILELILSSFRKQKERIIKEQPVNVTIDAGVVKLVDTPGLGPGAL